MASAQTCDGGHLVSAGRHIDQVRVAIADFKVSRCPGDATSEDTVVLVSRGLGSCVGVAIFDPDARVGGLAHILLPHARRDDDGQIIGSPTKYADTGLARMLDEMIDAGAERPRCRAKLAGGANMFPNVRKTVHPHQEANKTVPAEPVGARNVAAIEDVLASWGIPIDGRDTGGHYGRTLEFDLRTGVLTVRAAVAETRIL